IEDQFTFYSTYHNDPINRRIHMTCIWPILWTTTALIAECSPLYPIPEALVKYFPFVTERWDLTWATPITAVYIVLYVSQVLDPVAGSLASLLVLGCLKTSERWV
ncbi:unnamed protein product, partial [Choristocarpus tenellus]